MAVSTDDEEIAGVARDCGAAVPFVRPADLCGDFIGTTEVVAHATQWGLSQGLPLKAVCCVYATAPLIQVDDMERSLPALESGNWFYAFAATDFATSIFRSFRLSSKGGVEMFYPEYFENRSQDLPQALHDAAQFYWGRPLAWLAGERIFDVHSFPVLIPRWRVQDIDTEEDWTRPTSCTDSQRHSL